MYENEFEELLEDVDEADIIDEIEIIFDSGKLYLVNTEDIEESELSIFKYKAKINSSIREEIHFTEKEIEHIRIKREFESVIGEN